MTRSLDIILPCFNPPLGWDFIVTQTWKELREKLPQEVNARLVIVNDGSTSGISRAQVIQLMKKIPELRYLQHQKNRGKGYTLRQGVRTSNADLILYTDIDFPYSTSSMLVLIQQLLDDTCDVAVGVREDAYYEQLKPMRAKISSWLRMTNAKLLKLKINDTQGGLKGFNVKGKDVFLSTEVDRYLFDLEFIKRASDQQNLRLKPIKVELKKGIQFTEVGWKILLTESINYLKILFS